MPSDEPFRDAEARLTAVIERARATETTEAVCSRAGKRWQLELWGSLPPSWAGNLSLHCCGVGLDIVEGVAARVAGSRWAASFVLAPAARRSVNLGVFDFVRMARRRPSGSTQAGLPRLDEFAFARTANGGGLSVSARGEDEPGFLAALLARFALFELHPNRFAIGCEGDRAVDWFLLQTGRGGDPSPHCVAALRAALTACLVSPAGAAVAPASLRG